MTNLRDLYQKLETLIERGEELTIEEAEILADFLSPATTNISAEKNKEQATKLIGDACDFRAYEANEDMHRIGTTERVTSGNLVWARIGLGVKAGMQIGSPERKNFFTKFTYPEKPDQLLETLKIIFMERQIQDLDIQEDFENNSELIKEKKDEPQISSLQAIINARKNNSSSPTND